MMVINRRPVSLTLSIEALFGGLVGFFGWAFLGFWTCLTWIAFLNNDVHIPKSSSMILVLFIGPALGLAVIIVKFVKGFHAITLLGNGRIALGMLTAIEDTCFAAGHDGGGGKPYYRLLFHFTAHTGQCYVAKFLTTDLTPAWERFYRQTHHVPEQYTVTNYRTTGQDELSEKVYTEFSTPVGALPSPTANQLQEIILYHPNNPQFARLGIDLVPGISLNLQGDISGERPWRGILASITPIIVVTCLFVLLLHTLLLRH